jgi:hypothetical protein
VAGQYDTTVDRESAFEMLAKRTDSTAAPAETAPSGEEGGGTVKWYGTIFGTTRKSGARLTATQRVAREVTRTVVSRTAGQLAADVGRQLGGSVGGSIGRAIVRGILGGILRR